MVLTYKTLLQKLTPIMDTAQAEAELGLIFEHIDFSKKDLLIGKTLTEKQLQKINEIIEIRLTKRMPIQHILGYGYFMGEKFEVNPNVLIPRPETELLVEKIISFNGETVLDIGTGSGCIAIMVKKLSSKNVWACDISKKALETAQKNAQNLNCEINFVHSDLFSNIKQTFDIIVSNPPYIPHSAKIDMTQEVTEHEPHLALFAEDIEGIDFYQKIIEQASDYLKPKGYLAFEIGINQYQLISDILKKNNFKDIQVIKDLAGIERIITARKDM